MAVLATAAVTASPCTAGCALPQWKGASLGRAAVSVPSLSPRHAATTRRGAPSVRAAASTSEAPTDTEPVPVVVIDQHSEENATVLELEFGNRLGALLDTAAALKLLGLNVVKGKVATEKGKGRNRFVITKGGKKVEDPETIEAIRGTVISNLLKYHPDSRASLAMARSLSPEAEAAKATVPTKILVQSIDDGARSELYVETADYPGLLLEIVKELKDLSIDVESAEIDTEGLVAKDHFFVTYHGEALNSSMVQVTKNCLMYFLSRREIEDEESY